VKFLGAGLTYRPIHRETLLQDGIGPDILEIAPEDFYAQPSELEALAERYRLAFHCIGLSVGTAVAHPLGDEVARSRLERLRALVRRVKPIYVSDHLAFTRAPNGIDLGQPCPLPYTNEAYDVVAVRVSAWQDRLEVPLLLENIAHPFFWHEDTTSAGGAMSAGTFFDRLTRDTDCGLLLDVTSVLYDARNFRRAPSSLLHEFPLDEARAVHLAGGTHSSRDHFWTDTHDQPVEAESFALVSALRDRPKLQTVIIERHRRPPPLAELLSEGRRAVEILRGPSAAVR
jgi:uncharacterized protein (UPF0276 family)